MKVTSLAAALALGLAGSAFAADSPSDADQGIGNDPPSGGSKKGGGGKGKGHPGGSGPGQSFLDGGLMILAHHTNGTDKHGTDKPSGPSGPGQKGQPGKEGNSGP